MDLTEAEDIKKRWQEYTELYKKYLHDPDNHDGVITHLEPDILECEVKWALKSITRNKVSEGDGIPVELFQILKDDSVKVPANLENSAVATGLEKVSFHSNPKERQCQRMLKLLHGCTHTQSPAQLFMGSGQGSRGGKTGGVRSRPPSPPHPTPPHPTAREPPCPVECFGVK